MSQRILIVDGEPNLVLSLSFLLEQAGFQVSAVGDAESALAAMDQQSPALVLLDLILPGRDGFSVCEEIRRQPRWDEVKILVITARGRAVEREKALALGADGFIVKPFMIQAVVDNARQLLGESVI